jgi:hypothetical protein
MMKLRQNKWFGGGPSGARSRDLRIKRPHLKPQLTSVFLGWIGGLVHPQKPTVNHCLENRHFVEDPMAELSRWGCP